MNVGDSVRLSINDWERDGLDALMLHACNAIDGTAKKAYPKILGSNARFTTLLRDNYSVLGPMGVPGINLHDTRFPIKVNNPKASGSEPDLADHLWNSPLLSWAWGRIAKRIRAISRRRRCSTSNSNSYKQWGDQT